jgi:hypothetical protein
MKSNYGPVNVLHNGLSADTRTSVQAGYNMSTTSEAIRESSLSSVRKLPKKRKFDLSELEENIKTENVATTLVTNNYSSTTNTITNAVNTSPPQSMAVDYSCIAPNNSITFANSRNLPVSKTLPPKLEPSHPYYQETAIGQEYYAQNAGFPMPTVGEKSDASDKLSIALHEWIDHRVLAKRNEMYFPGIIRKADSTVGNIWIEFDNNAEDLVVYQDVLHAGRYDVISDASPSLSQVTVGSRVCVRTTGSLVDDKQLQARIFVEGSVFKILPAPTRFVIRLASSENKEYIASRADIRLLQPPWSDELENDVEHELPPPLLP